MIRKLAFVLSIFLLLSACERRPLLENVSNDLIVTQSGATPTIAQVRTAIRNAATGKDWKLKETGSNSYLITFTRGKRYAHAVINYSTKAFSITYKSSYRLGYRPAISDWDVEHNGPTIHRIYNKWVRVLQKNIKANLLSL
jgi:hypothetical protein